MVSGCLLGEAVRYDGGDKSLGPLREVLQGELQLRSVCPEVYAGMGTPRPPVQWVELASGERQLLQVDNPDISAREQLQAGCRNWCDNWQGEAPMAALLKARSPSCGNGTTPLLNEAGKQQGTMDGAFVQQLKRRWPQLWIVDESAVETEADALWLCRLLQWRQWQGATDVLLPSLLALTGEERRAWWRKQMASLAPPQ
nr:DUF523 domain-containing protein [Pseudomaricurvus sp. HS19]